MLLLYILVLLLIITQATTFYILFKIMRIYFLMQEEFMAHDDELIDLRNQIENLK